MGVLENCVREDLGDIAERRMAVLRPLKVVLTNYPEGQVEMMEAMNHPNNPDMGTREIPFSRELWIEQDDFMEEAPRKFFRLKPGGEVRLREVVDVAACDGCGCRSTIFANRVLIDGDR